MIVNEIFEGIQGEGKYVGQPALFIRMSKCNLSCDFCDTKYHNEGTEMTVDEMVKKIEESEMDVIIFTGGEPTLQREEIGKVIDIVEYSNNNPLKKLKDFHVETNGIITDNEFFALFDYVCFSPKNKKYLKDLVLKINPYLYEYDIKIVTDGENLGMDMILNATILMPLSTFNRSEDKKIRKKVWQLCLEKNIKYSPRIHVDVWNLKRRK